MVSLASAFGDLANKIGDTVNNLPPWMRLGYLSLEEWEAAGSPLTPKPTPLANAGSFTAGAAAAPAATVQTPAQTMDAMEQVELAMQPAAIAPPPPRVDTPNIISNFQQGVDLALSPEGSQAGYGFNQGPAYPAPDRGPLGDIASFAGNAIGDVAGVVGSLPIAPALGAIPGLQLANTAVEAVRGQPTTVGDAVDAYNTDIPVYSDFARETLSPAIGDVAGELFNSPLNPAAPLINAASDLIGTPDARSMGEFAGEMVTPITAGDVVLELLPGIGSAPDALRALKRSGLVDEAGRFVAGVTRARINEALATVGRTYDDLIRSAPIGPRGGIGGPLDNLERQVGDEAARMADEGITGADDALRGSPLSPVDEVPATPPGSAAGASTPAPADTPPPTPPKVTPGEPLSEGDAVMALRSALREGTGQERARLVMEGRRAQAARLREAVGASDEQGRALADAVRGTGAGRMLPEEGLGFKLPKEADDALIDKAMRLMQEGSMSPQEAIYGVVKALDEGRRLGPSPYQAKILSKLTSIDEAAFAPYVRTRVGMDDAWKRMVADEVNKVTDPVPSVQQQLRSAKRAELEAERLDMAGKSNEAASARLRANVHYAKADNARAAAIRKAEEAETQRSIAEAARRQRQLDLEETRAGRQQGEAFQRERREFERATDAFDRADRAEAERLNAASTRAISGQEDRLVREAAAEGRKDLSAARRVDEAAYRAEREAEVAQIGLDQPPVVREQLQAARRAELDAMRTESRAPDVARRALPDLQKRSQTFWNEAQRHAAEAESLRLARLERESGLAQDAWNNAMMRDPQGALRREGEIAERHIQQFDNIDKSPDHILDEAFNKIMNGAFDGTLGTENALKAWEVLRYHLKGNRAVLDSLKNAEGWREYTAGLRATVTGELADSYLTSLIHRTMWLRQGLTEAGIESDMASKIVNAVRNAELRKRFPGGVPARITRELDTMKAAPYEESLKGVELFIQRWKNTAFSTDAGVIGVQLLAALRRGGINMLAGVVNKQLAIHGMRHADVYRADVELPKRLRNILDGVMSGSKQSAVEPEAGTLLSYLGPWARQVDEGVIAKALDRANRVQFDGMMGWAGDAAYEGNLAILRMLGRDINNPLVRQQAADSANAIKSFSETALRSRRSGLERALLTSASMTRAGVANILQMSKFLNPTATAEQRILAATLIGSQALYMMTVGKFINDQIGITDFVFNPGEPGFGTITTDAKDNNGRNLVISLVPQASVERAMGQSLMALAEGDIDAALDAVGRYFGNRGSVLGRFLAGDDRFSLSDQLGADGLPRVVQNALDLFPTPPLFESILTDGFDPIRNALDFVGVSSYGESAFSPLNRARTQAIEALIAEGVLPEDLYPQGINYYDLGPGSRDLVNARVNEENPKLLIDYEADRRDRDNVFQTAADTARLNEAGQGAKLDPKTGEITGGQYAQTLLMAMHGIATGAHDIIEARRIMENARKQYDASQAAKRTPYQSEEYQKAIEGLPKTDINVQLSEWYDVFYQSQDPTTGLIDYDLVDRKHNELIQQWNEIDPQSVNKFLFELDNQERAFPELIQMDKDLKALQRDSGYHDLSDEGKEQWWAEHPQEAAMSWLMGGRKLPSIEAMQEALNLKDIGLGEGREDINLRDFGFAVNSVEDLEVFANLYDVVEREYLSLPGGKRGGFLDKNPDINALLVFLGYDVKLREGAEGELERLRERYGRPASAPEVEEALPPMRPGGPEVFEDWRENDIWSGAAELVNNSMAFDPGLEWQELSASPETLKKVTADRFESAGIDRRFFDTAPATSFSMGTEHYGGAYYPSENRVDLQKPTGPTLTGNSDYYLSTVAHEYAHAFEFNLTPEETAELASIMERNPTALEALGYADGEYHPGALTRYFDQWESGTTRGTTQDASSAAFGLMTSGNPKLAQIPPEVIRFINEHIEEILKRTRPVVTPPLIGTSP